MKLCIIASPIRDAEGWYSWIKAGFEKLGHQVVEVPDAECDFIIGMSVTHARRIWEAHRAFPQIPMVNYNWDVYAWVWTRPRKGEYDYKDYGEILKRSAEIWVPSNCTIIRTEQWYGLAHKTHRILSMAPYFDAEPRDDGYLLNPLREIPDQDWGRFERACEDLGIPYKSSKHELEWEDYKSLVAGARAIVSSLYELSTGSLTLLEGYYLGKPVLMSDSPWHGGRDYFGDRSLYFDHTSEIDFREKLKYIWENASKLVVPDQRSFVVDNYAGEKMTLRMEERLLILKEELSKEKANAI